MRGPIICVFALLLFTSAQGDEEEQLEKFMEAAEESLQCFRCDLGFWDACYTTETNCSLGERCFTGRGKAADVLDVKTLGCVREDECNVETTVELFANKTLFVMTKHCCDTSFCNSARRPLVNTLLYLTVAALSAWIFADDSGSPPLAQIY